MRILTEQELNEVSAAYCPLCFAASTLALFGVSTTAFGLISDEFYLYVSGTILLALSTAVAIQFTLCH